MTKKSDSKWLSLATVPILGQPARARPIDRQVNWYFRVLVSNILDKS
jgi:hypothetical protein